MRIRIKPCKIAVRFIKKYETNTFETALCFTAAHETLSLICIDLRNLVEKKKTNKINTLALRFLGGPLTKCVLGPAWCAWLLNPGGAARRVGEGSGREEGRQVIRGRSQRGQGRCMLRGWRGRRMWETSVQAWMSNLREAIEKPILKGWEIKKGIRRGSLPVLEGEEKSFSVG